ncbi:cation diffusion facilitator family transporter [Marinobacter sp. NFXS9]|uniref:cation diffusion facilitator family transporter n=1 Tax=Marinobacter sp. NFXS9 TaxID=2818433 RepID=UPI0032DFFF46
MDSCCENKAGELAELKGRQGRVLYIVLAINTAMFLFEFFGGLWVGSTALLADSLDMFGDATVYALTLYALHRSARTRAGAAMVKGIFMLLFGVMVIIEAINKSLLGIVPQAEWMGAIALVALVANTACFLLLNAHRSDDLNMRSTWLCSRNDLFANTSVIIAAGLVAYTGTPWPDVIVGLAIAVLFLHSAWQVLTEAWREWKRADSDDSIEVPGATVVPADDSCSIDDAEPEGSSCSTSGKPQKKGGCCGPGTDDHCDSDAGSKVKP